MWISYLHQNFLLSITWYWFINFRDAVCVAEKSKMKTPLISVSLKTHSLEMTPCYMFIWWMGLVIPSCFFSKDLNPVHEDRDRLEHHIILWTYQYSNHTIAQVKQSYIWISSANEHIAKYMFQGDNKIFCKRSYNQKFTYTLIPLI